MIVHAARTAMFLAYLAVHPGATLLPSASQTAPEAPRRAAEVQQVSGGVWDRLAACESGGDWRSTEGLYEGGLQFHPGTWDASKPPGYPDAAYQASKGQQIAVAEVVLDEQGWGAWPVCSRKIGAR